MLRSAWTAQELLTTFNGTVGEVALVPNHEGDGTWEVTLLTSEGELRIWSRADEGRFPENKEPIYTIPVKNENNKTNEDKIEITLKFISLVELNRGAFEYEIEKQYYAKDTECEISIQSAFKVEKA